MSYTSNTAAGTFATGTFTVSPKPGDQLAVSIFYDQHGHYSLHRHRLHPGRRPDGHGAGALRGFDGPELRRSAGEHR